MPVPRAAPSAPTWAPPLLAVPLPCPGLDRCLQSRAPACRTGLASGVLPRPAAGSAARVPPSRRYRGLPRGPVAPRRLRYHCTPSLPTQPRSVGSAVPPTPWDSPTGTMPTLAPQHAPPFSTHATTHNSGIKSDSMRRPSRKLSPTLAECTRYILESLIPGHNHETIQPRRLFSPIVALGTACA